MTLDERIEQIHSLVIEQGKDIAVIKSKIEAMPKTFACATHAGYFDDHEERLRGLENFRAQFKGALFIVAGLGGFLGAVFGLIVDFIKK